MTAPKNTPPEPVTIEPEAPESQQPQETDGILVIKRKDPMTGEVTTVLQTIGNVEVTEAQTILELGIKSLRKQLGLS